MTLRQSQRLGAARTTLAGIRVGSSDEVAATMKRFKDIGIDQLVTCPAAGWYEPHEVSMESIRVTGEKVLPQVR